VGIHMFRGAARIEWRRLDQAAPAFLTIVLMPLTHSISLGLAFGFVASIVAAVAAGRARQVHPLLWGIGVFSVVQIAMAG